MTEPTPRTDRAVQLTTWEGTSVYELVRADFARNLEREHAQAEAASSALRAEIGAIANAPWGNFRDADEFRAWALNRCRATLASGESIQRGKG